LEDTAAFKGRFLKSYSYQLLFFLNRN